MEGADGVGPVGEEERAVQPLADGQRRVLRVIQQFHDAYGLYPTTAFVAAYLRLDYTTVREHLRACHRKGWLQTPRPEGLWCRVRG